MSTITRPPEVRVEAAEGGKEHPWASFLLRRLAQFVLALFLMVTGVFWMIHLIPGDPVRNALGIKASPALVAADRRSLGLDRPLLDQYVTYLHNLVTGRLGDSLITGVPVKTLLADQLPATATLAGAAFVVAVVIAIPLGMIVGIATANGRRRSLHLGFASGTGFLSVLPEFVLGVLLQFVFGVTLKALPVASRGGLDSYVLPVATLAIGAAMLLSRLVRVETQRVLREEYMRTARAKRLPWRLMYLRHALPNLLTAALTTGGLTLSGLLAGTVLVESIFAWPGIGAQLVSSTLAKDFPVVQALALLFGATALVINLLVDIAIMMVNPQSTIKEG